MLGLQYHRSQPFSSFIMRANIRMRRGSPALSVLETQLLWPSTILLPSLSPGTHQECNRLDACPTCQLPASRNQNCFLGSDEEIWRVLWSAVNSSHCPTSSPSQLWTVVVWDTGTPSADELDLMGTFILPYVTVLLGVEFINGEERWVSKLMSWAGSGPWSLFGACKEFGLRFYCECNGRH